ncbi:MAG TPA: cardiolipin synthase, partial [Phycisphaerales bacterium]|nr:cardiolipin synthase [Phycisphaerales bacterium]
MLTSSWPLIFIIGEFTLKVLVIAIVILQRKKTASAKLSWILLIVFIPFVGSVIYLLFGTMRLGSTRMKRHKKIL